MKCSRCGHVGPEVDFTKGNLSHGGMVGRCKKCKREIDAAYNIRENFKLIPDMLDKKKPDIGVLLLHRIVDRRIDKNKGRFFIEPNFGLKAILSELKQPYEICYPELINDYKQILISLTSVMDVENLIYTFEKYAPDNVTAEIIVGGFGVINIWLISRYIDVAVFGRAEDQVNAILSGHSFPNVWRKANDPNITGTYKIRQARRLLPGEVSVGCRNHCRYCQYTHIRLPLGNPAKYNPGDGITIQETDWHGLRVDKAGKYITAWDGMSEATRLRVGKHITDKQIIDKLISIGNQDIDGAVSIKVFMVIGYPWETAATVRQDMEQVVDMLLVVDMAIRNRVIIAILLSPFAPEPITPMACEPADVHTNWRDEVGPLKIFNGALMQAFIIPSIMGPWSLVKRVLINRATNSDTDLDQFKRVAFNKRLKRMPERAKVPWLLTNNHIKHEQFDTIESTPCNYLAIGRGRAGKISTTFSR